MPGGPGRRPDGRLDGWGKITQGVRGVLDRLTSRDAHACHGLAGECRELGADTDSWRLRLLEGLRALVDARVVIMAELVNFGPDESAEALWRDYAQSTPVERTPEFPYVSRFAGGRLTLSRDEIWGRETWY